MEIVLTLTLPRDEMTVPVARRIIDTSMRSVGVEDACVSDIVVALTEACTNVLKHSGPGDEYEVRYTLRNGSCSIDVTDVGRGFDFETLSRDGAATDAERGRGVQLMRALVDSVRFESKPATGSVVHLEKRLQSVDGSLLDRAERAEGIVATP